MKQPTIIAPSILSADFAQPGGLFEQHRRKSGTLQRQGRGQTGDAGANDVDAKVAIQRIQP